MKSNKITQMIREELKKVIKEESQNRYVVTVQFYVWGNNEVSAKKEAAQVIQTIEHKYDNSPQVTDIASQQFGKFGSTPINQEQKVTEATAITKQPRYKEVFRIIGEYMFSINVNIKPKQVHDLTLEMIDFLDSNKAPEETISDIISQYLFSINIKLKPRQLKALSDEIKEYLLTPNTSAFKNPNF